MTPSSRSDIGATGPALNEGEAEALLAALMAGWNRYAELTHHPDPKVAENAQRRCEAINAMATRWFGSDWTD